MLRIIFIQFPQPMNKILPFIVVAQFLSTSLWFAGNAVLPDIITAFDLPAGYLAHITSAVQFGFISGTLVFALFTIADRFSPSRVFFASSLLAALFNLGVLLPGNESAGILIFRFATGFFLAGIYPVGMKIASDYFQKGLGKSLGLLVGALVLGTAFPHLLKNFTSHLPWKLVIITTSFLSVLGGFIILLGVPDGPFRKKSNQFNWKTFLISFRDRHFRSAAFGYFGHMWELYTFWAFVPVMLFTYQQNFPGENFDIPLLSFFIIASGGLACFISGWKSNDVGVKKLATICLFLSSICCLISPWLLFVVPVNVLIIFLVFWGMVVVADSPLFSTLVANNASPEYRGTSLTIVNCIGFSITIISIQFINLAGSYFGKYIFMLLSIGPILGLVALLMKPKENTK